MHPILEIQSTPFLEVSKLAPKEEKSAPKSDFLALVQEITREPVEEELVAELEEGSVVDEEIDLEDMEISSEEEIDSIPIPVLWEKKIEVSDVSANEDLVEETNYFQIPIEDLKLEEEIETIESDNQVIPVLKDIPLLISSETKELETEEVLPSISEVLVSDVPKASNLSVDESSTQTSVNPIDTKEIPIEVYEGVLLATPMKENLDLEQEVVGETLVLDSKETKPKRGNEKITRNMGENTESDFSKESKEEIKAPRTSLELLSEMRAKEKEDLDGKLVEKPKKSEIQIHNLSTQPPKPESVTMEGKNHSSDKENPVFVQWTGQRINTKNSESVAKTESTREAREAFQKNLNEIVKTAKFQIVENGKNTARIELTPRELGKMTLHVTMEKDRVEGKIIVETEFARAAISSELSSLRLELKEAGLDLDFLSIDMNQRDETFFSAEDEKEESSARGNLSSPESLDDSEVDEMTHPNQRKLIDIKV